MAHINPIQIQKFLKGVDYPATKAALLDKARSLGADENVCASLEQLPDEEYPTPTAVSHAFGELPDEAMPARAGARGQARGSEFLAVAMQNAMAEVQICELAIDKLDRPEAKDFAQAMIDEHGRMGRELEQLALKKNLELPQAVRPEQDMTVEELAAVQGRDFEQRWIQYNIDVHERDIKVFRHYAGEESDPDIQQLAQRHSEDMARHLKMAHQVALKLAKP